jgi:hypothetical protein
MDWVDLGHPRPRDLPETYHPVSWAFDQLTPLGATDHDLKLSVGSALGCRRSSRYLGSMPPSKLAALLGAVSRVHDRRETAFGFPIERRPTPSAGAIHPIHIVVSGPGTPWSRYDAASHSLYRLSNGHLLEPLHPACAELIEAPEAWILLFVAEPGLTAAKYAFAQSLVWRDAGVLQGTLAIAAEALDIGYCLLGITGEPWASGLANQHELVGVGVALAGGR